VDAPDAGDRPGSAIPLAIVRDGAPSGPDPVADPNDFLKKPWLH
jgi:hypothetical protein